MTVRLMTGQALLVLTALADGPRHAYGIVGEVAELPQGRVRPKIAGLHGVLDRLAAGGTNGPDREVAHDGRLRRYCRLTRDGRRVAGRIRAIPLRRSHVYTGSCRCCCRAGNKLSSSSA